MLQWQRDFQGGLVGLEGLAQRWCFGPCLAVHGVPVAGAHVHPQIHSAQSLGSVGMKPEQGSPQEGAASWDARMSEVRKALG